MCTAIKAFMPAAVGCLLGVGCGGGDGDDHVIEPDEPVATRLSFAGTVRLDETPAQGDSVWLTWCDEWDLLGNCIGPRAIGDITDESGRYSLSRSTQCHRGERLAPFSTSHCGLTAKIYMDDSAYQYVSGSAELQCTEDVQVVDFDLVTALVISGHVSRADGLPLGPFIRVQVWREGAADPWLQHSLRPDGSYRVGFTDCPPTAEGVPHFVQAAEPGSNLRSERAYIGSCEPKFQTLDLVLELQSD